jgi:hypothetical protein
VFYLMGNSDSARAEMTQAIAKLWEKDTKNFVWLYESKAVLEHFIGLTYERQSHIGPAREAYGRGLQEDLSYYPAHMRLGTIALSTGDTATALSEMDLAAQINNDEPVLQATYGMILAQSGHISEAHSTSIAPSSSIRSTPTRTTCWAGWTNLRASPVTRPATTVPTSGTRTRRIPASPMSNGGSQR